MLPTGSMLRPAGLAFALSLCMAPAFAHDMWVNASSAHDESSVTVVTSLGWGHAPLPLAEFFPTARLSAYRLIGPDGQSFALPFDKGANADVNRPVDGLAGLTRLQAGDPLMRRLSFDAKAAAGGWRVHAASPAVVRTTWIDAGGEVRAGPRFADEIKDARNILSSVVTVRDATAWWRVGERGEGAWSASVAQGAVFELVPQADPSALRAPGSLAVKAVWNGADLPQGAQAKFSGWGENNIEAEITEPSAGGATFAIAHPGVWLLRAELLVPVARAGNAYAEFAGRVENIRFVSTLALHVAPSAGK